MKRLLLTLILSLFLAVGAFAGDETITQSVTFAGKGPDRIVYVTFDIVGDSTDGSIADTDFETSIMNYIKGLCLLEVQADPGTTAPDAANVLIKDSGDLDLLGGNGTNLIHATDKQATHPSNDGQPMKRAVIDTLTLDVDLQDTLSANYVLVAVFGKPN